jgi:muramoyltetrapeptide carboxypeptidase
MLKKPERLKKGDKIGIFVPSSPVRDSFRQDGLDRLRRMGYVPVEVPNILGRREFLAKPVDENLEDIQILLNRSDIKALWAARGGYGSNHLLPGLDRLRINKPKIVLGSSDVSYLLWYLLDHFKMVVFYGPMAYSALAEDRVNLDQLESVLNGRAEGMTIEGLTLIPGRTRGLLTGGCLSNMVSLIGTRFFPNIRRRILLLEDRGEKPYRLDRMFWQLGQLGIFRKISGLVMGQFPECFRDKREKHRFFSRITEYLPDTGVPVVVDLPLGHGERLFTVPLGVEMEMDAGNSGRLIIRENGVG